VRTHTALGFVLTAATAAAGVLAVQACGPTSHTCEESRLCGGGGFAGSSGTASSGTGGESAGESGTSGGGASGSGHGGSGHAGTSGDAGSAGDGGTGCDATKSPSEETCLVSDEYAIFVAPTGKDGAGGSKAGPVKTIAKALTLAGKTKIVIACDGTFDEQVKLTAGAKLYGGFACPGGATPWIYESGKKAKVAPSTKGYALSIASGASSVVIEDFEFDAKDGVDAGESSIAAFVNTSTAVVLTRVKLVAGKGADGANGASVPTPAASGAPGSNGVAACTVTMIDTPNRGGAEVASMCGGAPSGSVGGKGGDGGINNSSGGNGERGAPVPQPDAGQGSAGGGEINSGWGCSVGAGLGGATAGANGLTQPDALGGTGGGTLTSTGYTPPSGVTALDGTPGQGGGGGGGAKAPTALAACGGNPRTGASGGSGGGGGCGGKGGGGGMGGGASIALASVSSTVALDHVDLVAVSGGNGGNGGARQPGGSGGKGGDGASATDAADSCAGGSGGKGGAGGNGGGGAGGPSLGIAFVGTAPTQSMVSTTLASAPSVGGADGTGATTGPGAGSAGLIANAKEF